MSSIQRGKDTREKVRKWLEENPGATQEQGCKDLGMSRSNFSNHATAIKRAGNKKVTVHKVPPPSKPEPKPKPGGQATVIIVGLSDLAAVLNTVAGKQ